MIDEELCGMVKKLIEPVEISDASLDLATIKEVGIGGNYLTHPTTFKHCRSLYQPYLFTRDDYQKWASKGSRCVADKTEKILSDRLAQYEKPPIDQGLEQALIEYVSRQKKWLTEKKFIF